MIVLIDNYDSFAHNLARYLRQLDQLVQVVRNDAISIADLKKQRPAAIVISPGPCTPDEAGICLSLVEHFESTIPMLGVCLGHQAICQALGGRIGRTRPVHGQASSIRHFGHPLFANIETPFVAGRYHSLIMQPETLPDRLEVLATCGDGIAMSVGHRHDPVFGVQFHPESVLTSCGYQLLGNFLQLAGIEVDHTRVEQLSSDLKSQSAPATKSEFIENELSS